MKRKCKSEYIIAKWMYKTLKCYKPLRISLIDGTTLYMSVERIAEESVLQCIQRRLGYTHFDILDLRTNSVVTPLVKILPFCHTSKVISSSLSLILTEINPFTPVHLSYKNVCLRSPQNVNVNEVSYSEFHTQLHPDTKVIYIQYKNNVLLIRTPPVTICDMKMSSTTFPQHTMRVLPNTYSNDASRDATVFCTFLQSLQTKLREDIMSAYIFEPYIQKEHLTLTHNDHNMSVIVNVPHTVLQDSLWSEQGWVYSSEVQLILECSYLWFTRETCGVQWNVKAIQHKF